MDLNKSVGHLSNTVNPLLKSMGLFATISGLLFTFISGKYAYDNSYLKIHTLDSALIGDTIRVIKYTELYVGSYFIDNRTDTLKQLIPKDIELEIQAGSNSPMQKDESKPAIGY